MSVQDVSGKPSADAVMFTSRRSSHEGFGSPPSTRALSARPHVLWMRLSTHAAERPCVLMRHRLTFQSSPQETTEASHVKDSQCS